MYKPKHFGLKELVPPDWYHHYQGADILWWLFDDRILLAADLLRERFGPMTVNDWAWAGNNQWRGFRPPDCPIGADLSQHKFGRALDLVPAETEAEAIRTEILAGHAAAGLITCIEADVWWLHIDCRMPEKAGVKVVYP